MLEAVPLCRYIAGEGSVYTIAEGPKIGWCSQEDQHFLCFISLQEQDIA